MSSDKPKKHAGEKIVWKNNSFFKEVEGALHQGKKVKIAVRGSSMNPVLREGDVVVLETEKLPIKKDIVLAKYEGSYILHRIVGITANYFFLAGDGNKLQVERVKKSQVLAVVAEAFRGEESLALRVMGTNIQQFKQCLLRFFWYIIYSIKKRFL